MQNYFQYDFKLAFYLQFFSKKKDYSTIIKSDVVKDITVKFKGLYYMICICI